MKGPKEANLKNQPPPKDPPAGILGPDLVSGIAGMTEIMDMGGWTIIPLALQSKVVLPLIASIPHCTPFPTASPPTTATETTKIAVRGPSTCDVYTILPLL